MGMAQELVSARRVLRLNVDEFWLTHGILPLLAFLLLASTILVLGIDVKLAQWLFYDTHSGRWLGSGAGQWWAQNLLHSGGRDLIRGIAAGALVTCALSLRGNGRWVRWRGPSLYCLATIATTVLLVALLKSLTHVDCPWDLTIFGGTRPYVDLLSMHPAQPHAGACFPGGHSSSGFSLVCFYFVFRDRSPGHARIALLAALTVGAVFAFGQEARGAHFLLHDLTSAACAWFVALLFYRLGQTQSRISGMS